MRDAKVEHRSRYGMASHAREEHEHPEDARLPVRFRAGALSADEWQTAGKYLTEREFSGLVNRVNEWRAYVARTDNTPLADIAVGPSISRWLTRAALRRAQDPESIERTVKSAVTIFEKTPGPVEVFGELRRQAEARKAAISEQLES